MMIVAQLVRDDRTVARVITEGPLDRPLEDIMDEVAAHSHIRHPGLSRTGAMIEVFWIENNGGQANIVRTSRLSPDPLTRKDPGTNRPASWLKAYLESDG